jgi:predicted phage terminase large subunit-like protein
MLLSSNEFWILYKQLSTAGKHDAAKLILIERCRYDVETFALTFFPHYCEYDFNQFHRDCFADWRQNKRRVRRADAAPRGSAKSTVKTLIKPIHDLCYGHENFIIIVSDTQSQAVGKLKDIRSELLDNDLLLSHFGTFFRSKNVAETSFVARCGDNKVLFQAYGAGSEIRGIRFGQHRPSKIILDDAENSEEVFNEEIRAKREDWFKQVISKLGNKTTNIEVVGTVLHKQSLLRNLFDNPSYRCRMYKAVVSWADREDLWQKWREIYGNLESELEKRQHDSHAFFLANRVEMMRGAKVLWPERESYEDLMREMFELGRKAFFKELQNEPIASDQALFDTMHWYVEEPDGYRIEKTGVLVPWASLNDSLAAMDPSAGQTKAKPGKLGDFTSILVGRTDQRGRLFVGCDWTKRAAPTKYIAALFELWELYRYNKMAVETNMYRNLLLPNIATEKEARERKRRADKMEGWAIDVKFYDVENTENKIKRIYTLEPKVENGYILFNKNLSAEFKNQMESFPLGEHDDGPDALEMLWKLANGRYQATGLPISAQQRGR